MAWYKTGTLTVTNGQTSVTGVGTKFTSNARVGDGLTGPDGKWYEVVNITSETVLGIYPAYAGPTVSGSTNWTIAPLQGYVKESADQLRAITNQYGTTLGLLGTPTTQAQLRTNIGAAKSGANSDITGITGLTTMLAVNQGGTGSNTAAGARTNLGLGTSAVLSSSETQAAESLNLPSTSLTRIAEAVYAARNLHGFYVTSSSAPVNIDTVPTGWCGLVSSTAGTMPPGLATAWIETQATYTGGSAIQIAYNYGGSSTAAALLIPQMWIRLRNQPGTAWGVWQRIQTSNEVVTSNDDATQGKLMTTGYLGLGGVGSPAITSLDVSRPGGISWVTSGTTGIIAGYPSGSIVFTMNASTSHSTEMMFAHNLNSRFAIRRKVNGTYGNWIEPYMPWYIVGTVAGTSANVQGAIIERGTNVNGNYTKFADGTMICWGRVTTSAVAINGAFLGGFASASQTFPFPVNFVGSVPSLTCQAYGLTAFGVIGSTSTTLAQGAVQLTAVTNQSATAVRTFDWQAIGRWAN